MNFVNNDYHYVKSEIFKFILLKNGNNKIKNSRL